ncbi:sugar ABC transporter ATP-binding protein [Nocardioides mangrovi]|uniref:Sugar ABC transporter ATP-binding protein n=1 Tax=Nocardioides mangrovi TaxID=2874580 RepID=A0ABS7UIS8_9ACTN|nr:sugar ABC transporter ATP-binding protein [Nocardioides mangrovi]MBZ5740936.1 sugar ABC transporter ATP-binding protein [Nocardioides mangrovi]
MTAAPDLPTVTEGATALSISGLTKRFGATLALDEASLAVRPGTVHALLGGNGSGKSTSIKVLAAVHQADAGQLTVGGREYDLRSFDSVDARAAGLRFVHQDLGLFDGLSIAENFALDAGFPLQAGTRIRWAHLHERVTSVLDSYELHVDPRTPINELRPADRTMVAIARALQDADTSADGESLILVLDEPTASLAQHESALLLARIRRLADQGQTVVLVSHRMSEVLSVADDFTIFRDGRTVATLVDASPTEDELVELMAGRAVDALRPVAASSAADELRLEVRGLVSGPLAGIDLQARRGEIVGVAGLVGSGRSSLLRTIFGDLSPRAGTMSINGRPHVPRDVAGAMRDGVALVPEDRGREAAFADLTIADNLSMTRLRTYWSWRGMNARAEQDVSRRLISDFRVKASGPAAPFTSMSGGNQQKVILARWLQRDPAVLLLDEPTQGVDVMSRVDIYRTVREAARRGTAVLVASSDASELLALCDRIVIIREGRVDEDLDAETLDPDDLTRKLLRATSVRQEDETA